MKEYIQRFAATSARIAEIIAAGEVSPQEIATIEKEREWLDRRQDDGEVCDSPVVAVLDLVSLDQVWNDAVIAELA